MKNDKYHAEKSSSMHWSSSPRPTGTSLFPPGVITERVSKPAQINENKESSHLTTFHLIILFKSLLHILNSSTTEFQFDNNTTPEMPWISINRVVKHSNEKLLLESAYLAHEEDHPPL